MVETQDLLKLNIGNEEAVTLKPTNVKVLNVKVIDITTTKKPAKKVVCEIKHPDNENPIQISAVKLEVKGKLDTSGLWLNLDNKGLIRKGSALAVFMQSQGCKVIEDLNGKDIPTATDENGYLVFKGY